MNPLTKVTKCLNLAFKQRLLKEENLFLTTLIASTLDIITDETERLNVEDPVTAGILEDIKSLTSSMLNSDKSIEFTLDSMLAQVKLSTVRDTSVQKAVIELLEQDNKPKRTLKKVIIRESRELQNENNKAEAEKTLYRAYRELKTSKVKDLTTYLGTLSAKIEEIEKNSAEDSTVVDVIDFSSDEQISSVVSKAKEKFIGSAVLKTEWSKYNDALGGGHRYGQFVLEPGSQHHYKTGRDLTIFRHLLTVNDPPDCGDKKPLALRITCEDPLTDNIGFLYKEMKYSFEKKIVDIQDADVSEVTAYVKKKLTSRGWHLKMMQIDPTTWSYKNIIETVLKLETQGYEVKIFHMDYLPMLSLAGTENTGVTGSAQRDLLRRVRNFTSARGILFMTPIQFSVEVDGLRGLMKSSDVIPAAVAGNKLDGARAQAQEPDVIFGAGIINHNGETYLHMVRGKLRGPYHVHENKRNFFLKFPSDGSPIPSWEQGIYSLPVSNGGYAGGAEDDIDLFK